ncbi:hypothetical protein BKA70DRAFT_1226607 [Coprinopsis sp. MPI-PUGE-AT-0042]|nr:hypothetical protein BKA70DRAFT_1226607 [Coprinopsis sp. MPI-PUGE-AT-0042]
MVPTTNVTGPMLDPVTHIAVKHLPLRGLSRAQREQPGFAVVGEAGANHAFPLEMMAQVVCDSDWWTMIALSHIHWLTVVVTSGKHSSFIEELRVDRMWREAENNVESVWVTSVGDDSRPSFIQVIESSSHTLQAIVTSPSTEDMVLISLSRMCVLYPPLLVRNMALQIDQWDNQQQKRLCPSISSNNADWGFECGPWCPDLWCHGCRGEGFGIFFWNQGEWDEACERARRSIADPEDRIDAGMTVDSEWHGLTVREAWFMNDLQATSFINHEEAKWLVARELIPHSSLEYNTVRATTGLWAVALRGCDPRPVGVYFRRASSWDRRSRFTPFVYETGCMTVNNMCSTLNAVMQLDARLAECAVKSLSASFVALRLWILWTPAPEPTKPMIPPGSSSLELYATYALMEQGASVLESSTKAPWIVDRFADVFIERLDVVDSMPITGRDSPELAEAERDLNICFIKVCIGSCSALEAQLHCQVVEDVIEDHALPGTPQRSPTVTTECNGNTVNAVLDYIKSGTFLAVLQTLRFVKSFEGLVLQATTIMFYQMNKYCYYVFLRKAGYLLVETARLEHGLVSCPPNFNSPSAHNSQMEARNKAQIRYHYTCRATQLEVVLNTVTPSYSIEEMDKAQSKHGVYITVFDTTKDPPEQYIYKLTINTYLWKHLQRDCAAMEERVDGLVREYATTLATMKSGKDDKGKEKENSSGRDRKGGEGEEGDVWLVDAGFTNGCDEMVALLMKIEKVMGRWKVVESVPRVFTGSARYNNRGTR